MNMPPRSGRRVVLFGECMIELQGQAFGAMQQSFGGDTLNTAVYLSRCGASRGIEAHYATALGDDRFSSGLIERWQGEGVRVGLVRRLPGRMPGLYMIEVDDKGERSFSYWRDTSAAKSYFEADITPLEEALPRTDALYLSGISLAILPVAGRERLLAAMASLRARGGTVVFDNNYRPRLWPDRATAAEWFAKAFAQASIALVTADDEQAVQGLPSIDAAITHSLSLPCAEVVVKRGAGSTLVRRAGEALCEVAAEPVARVVDTTAAGDSFAAGYLSVRLSGGSTAEAAALGNRLASRVIQHRGALIPREAMAELMR